ncbi:hypothetical protein AXF42_Ash021678 [Apostasia shenzhenica]|uniref:Uncharacterized protein n=1 Tax=Apostasia shenzhenica TaxID=1088818 RepID=A0A2H9ZSU2_9ASPA|nr:hypothetical protein AXF42_Ash021678 [Apostasia shenzhenica]
MLLSKLAERAPFLMSGSPRFRQARGSSSITESEKIFDINIFSSPVDSILEAATASELPFLNMDDSCNDLGLRQSNMKISVPPACFHFDPIEERFNRLAKQKPLPEKGRLVEAVIDAGPLLHTLSVGGNLPKWRNPPSLKPSFIPQMLSKTSESQHQRRMLPSLPIT